MTARLTVRQCMISATFILLAGCAMTSRQGDNGLTATPLSWMRGTHTRTVFSSKEPEAIVSDLHALNRFADTFSTNNDARTFGIVPYQLPPLPSRLIDPSAMVNACANHGAEVAMSLEQPMGSAELLITAFEAQNHFKKSND